MLAKSASQDLKYMQIHYRFATIVLINQGAEQMEYFLETIDTIDPGNGFEHFGALHMVWLMLALVTWIIVSRAYCRKDEETRARWRKTVAILIAADEVWKMVWLTIGGNYTFDYLPLHLCSINIIFIAIHAWKPTKLMDNFLYLVCIPGALAALIFPSWGSLPLANFMHLHSFTIHTLLVLYPVMLIAGGDIRPQIREFPKCVIFLLVMAVPIAIFNMIFDTNFMFLMYAGDGSPLLIFERMWGNHLLGYPVLLTAVLIVMCIPVLIMNRRKKD